MMLACSRRCGGRLFRALFAEVELDASGEFQDFRIAQPGYICLNCGSPAFDLGELPAERMAEAQAEAAEARPAAVDILCPVCEAMVHADDGMEGTNNGSRM